MPGEYLTALGPAAGCPICSSKRSLAAQRPLMESIWGGPSLAHRNPDLTYALVIRAPHAAARPLMVHWVVRIAIFTQFRYPTIALGRMIAFMTKDARSTGNQRRSATFRVRVGSWIPAQIVLIDGAADRGTASSLPRRRLPSSLALNINLGKKKRDCHDTVARARGGRAGRDRCILAGVDSPLDCRLLLCVTAHSNGPNPHTTGKLPRDMMHSRLWSADEHNATSYNDLE
ncbi:hypothetical protein C8F01DRAFT_1076907 [Mycena amicta]|nr:hypothetical protein C8F01DRAFT_1076907 [Mycena amicta]